MLSVGNKLIQERCLVSVGMSRDTKWKPGDQKKKTEELLRWVPLRKRTIGRRIRVET